MTARVEQVKSATPLPEENPRPVVLVVEDDRAMRELLASVLEPLPTRVIAVSSPQEALDCLESDEVAVVVTDLRMPGIDGIEVVKFAKKRNSLTQAVVITGYATVESAVEALKSGAYDYLRKPFEPIDLRLSVDRALQRYLLERENTQLREAAGSHTAIDGLVGKSQAIEGVQRLIAASASYDCCVLICGESGTGKEVVARQIHQASPRRGRRFVALNCAAIPENIIESELFGYQKGAFTGADRTKPGLFEAADGGTLFLDEINNASLALQAKLLRVLQDNSFFRLGDNEPRNVDVRLLAATNQPLPELVEAGTFRMDLYYRLKIIEIDILPLRNRQNDIPLLANHFLRRHAARLNKQVKGLSTKALTALMRHDWPGNGRELENMIQRMIILTTTETIDVDVLPPELLETADSPVKAVDFIAPQSLEEIEAHFIAKTLRETKGNRSATAEILGIDKSTLWRKIKRYQLE
jgi:DNA-binding NtrC family response regulator